MTTKKVWYPVGALDGRLLEKFVQKTTKKGTPLCVWCAKPIPGSYQRYYVHPGHVRLFHSDACGRAFGQWAAASLYVAAKDEREPKPYRDPRVELDAKLAAKP